MKKVTVFVLSLMVGAVMMIVMGVFASIKRLATLCHQQVLGCEERGRGYLTQIHSTQQRLTTSAMKQVKQAKSMVQTRATALWNQGKAVMKQTQELQAKAWNQGSEMVSNHASFAKQQVKDNLEKGANFMNNLKNQVVGFISGSIVTVFAVALFFTFQNGHQTEVTIVEKVVEDIVVEDESMVLPELPEVLDLLVIDTPLLDLASIEDLTEVVADDQEVVIEDTVVETEEISIEVEEVETVAETTSTPVQSSTTPQKDIVSAQPSIKPSQEEVSVVVPEKQPISTPEEEIIVPSEEIEMENPMTDSIETSETPAVDSTEEVEQPVIVLPGEEIIGDLIINDSLLQDLIPIS